jgi:REP element-mobilizing transposase RayT
VYARSDALARQYRVHARLRLAWHSAATWLVGRYVLMPDHVHLFCAPGSAFPHRPLDLWIREWKAAFSRVHAEPRCRWQSGYWDRQLRRSESYETKWTYVVDNPVRAGLVQSAADWPYAGELHVLQWR